jgi:hypothetical protein
MGQIESLTAPPDQIPWDNPFNASFYQAKRPIYTYYAEHQVDQARFRAGFQYLQLASRPAVNLQSADFAVLSELEAKTARNKGFVCGVSSPVFLLLVSDQLNLVEFGEIQYFGSRDTDGRGLVSFTPGRVRLAVPGRNERTMLNDLLAAYPPELAHHITILPWHRDLQFGRDYDIFVSLAVHPDPVFKYVVDQHFRVFRSGGHLMTMLKVNGGDYFVVAAERPFYRRHPYYTKRLFNLIDSISYYPVITRIGSQQFSWFIPTFSCNYLLVADPRVENLTVQRMLGWVAKTILDPTPRLKDWGWPSDHPAGAMSFPQATYNRVGLPNHPGATQFYRAINIEQEVPASEARRQQQAGEDAIIPLPAHISVDLGWNTGVRSP